MKWPISQVCEHKILPHSQLNRVCSLVGNDDRTQSGVPPNVPCIVVSATIL